MNPFSRRKVLAAAAAGGLLMTATGAEAGIDKGLPSLNIDKMCSDTGLTDGDAQCRRDETDARNKLRAQWSALPGHYKRHCIRNSLSDLSPSYVDLSGCLQVYLDLKNENQMGKEGISPDFNSRILNIETGN
jgi:hypothetical protein